MDREIRINKFADNANQDENWDTTSLAKNEIMG